MENFSKQLPKNSKQILIWILVLVFITLFFSYRLLDVPTGFTVDEDAFGYNAALLANTLHDQNNRLLPVFVLSIEGKDWRAPVTQYYLAAFFKLFGSTPFNLRFSSVIITLICTVLIFYLAKIIASKRLAIIAAVLFLTTPIIMIQSHLGLDNIMPVPFILVWLLGIALYEKKQKLKYLVLSGVSLGIGFYTYKGMRATAPVWSILTFAYLIWPLVINRSKKTFNQVLKPLITFCLAIAPFYIAAPILEWKYPGAVFDHQGFAWDNLYAFLSPYFSSYDISYFYIKGDDLAYHSTGRHGFVLLATLPLFVAGSYQAFVKRKFWAFLLIAFFTAPALYGLVDSVHRFSRLLAMLPPYILICAVGTLWLWERVNKFSSTRKFLAILVLLFVLNYLDFISYYWFTYPNTVKYLFGDMKRVDAYNSFHQIAVQKNLTPVIDTDVSRDDGEEGRFYSAMYFGYQVKLQTDEQPLQKNQILLSTKETIPGLEEIGTEVQGHRFFVLR